ncbi:MAG: protein kinase [Deltaproteobacteria bacterium]|nr:protein kinase [Deltaproteobacteria bacterium]
MPVPPEVSQAELPKCQLVFEHLAHLALSSTANVDLCRVVGTQHHGALVAVKRLRPLVAESPEFVTMFRDEMWLAAALKHPNVAQVLGWGEDQEGLVLAVEFVRGVSLQRLMRTVFATGEEFTERFIVYLASKVSDGLAAAHELRSAEGEFLNLVHRDLTPGNLLLSFDGDVKITDFGLAKAKRRVTHTASGFTKGEPAYMSPEQVCGRNLDARSDIFGLGVVLFELFAKRPPWVVRTVKDALEFIVEGRHADLAELCPRMDNALVETVDRCLAKEPEARFQSSRALKHELDEWLRLHGWQDNREALGRFVRRNAMRQMHWVERAIAGQAISEETPSPFDRSRSDTPVGSTPPRPEIADPDSSHSEPTVSFSRNPRREDGAATVRRPLPSNATETTATVPRPPRVLDPADGTATTFEGALARAARPAQPPTGGVPEPGAVQPVIRYQDPPASPPPGEVVDPRGAPPGPPPAAPGPPPTHHTPTPPSEPGLPGPPVSPPRPPAPVPPPQPPAVVGPVSSSAATSVSAKSSAEHTPVSSPVPLVIPAEEPSTMRRVNLPEQLRLVAHSLQSSAQQLAEKAAKAAQEAQQASEQAQQAAQTAQALARRVQIASDAVNLASAAIQAASDGDSDTAREQLRRAQELHDAATRS